MNITCPIRILALTCLLALAAAAPVAALEMHAVEFPERRAIELRFLRAPGAPDARLEAEVLFRDGQARIDLAFDSMKPAVLYGGDVTCYVVWAVTLSGRTENLGELLVREPKGKLSFATANKKFALLVTAEPYYLVSRPSELVVFSSAPFKTKREASESFAFNELDPAPEHAMQSIRQIAWDSDAPLDLLQARQAHEVATQRGAATHAPRVYDEAGQALTKANEIARKSPRSRTMYDQARRSVALSNEAINLTMHRLEAVELENRLAQRRSEMESVERRAQEAEAQADDARRAAETTLREQQRLSAEVYDLTRSRSELESSVSALQGKAERLAVEKQKLRAQLESALSNVADTRQTARGLVVNLPDILFDVDQASIKRETEIILAKLAGIMLIMPDLTAKVEGHTDSTGREEYNMHLSERRARSVVEFLGGESIDLARLTAEGYGISQPVADNATADGRAKNRRVEIIIDDGS